jgi:spermidine/putrescine transport system substrate-binding protein
MDEIFNKMKGESGAIASYYAGDFLSMYDANNHLAFFYPSEGTNVFVDAMCIPIDSRQKEIAECYINFMLSHDIAVANAEYICYASPNKLVIEDPDYIEYMNSMHEDAMEILYPSYEVKSTYYQNLSPETLVMLNGLWEELKIESSGGEGVYICSAVIAVTLTVWFGYLFIRKKYRDNY